MQGEGRLGGMAMLWDARPWVGRAGVSSRPRAVVGWVPVTSLLQATSFSAPTRLVSDRSWWQDTGAELGVAGEASARLRACAGRGKPPRRVGLRRGRAAEAAGAGGSLSSAPALQVALVYPRKAFLLQFFFFIKPYTFSLSSLSISTT